MKYTLEPGKDYIDHCVETVAGIDPEEIAQRELGELIGGSSHLTSRGTMTFELGNIATVHGALDIAYKDTAVNPDWRLVTELRDTAFILSRAPELLSKFPYFAGLIAIEGAYFASGIVTEDASRGNSVEVRNTRMSNETLGAIWHRFGGYIFIDNVILKQHTTFDVGGEERILDLAPSVFGAGATRHVRDREDFAEFHVRAKDAEGQLTIWIPPDSPLAISIVE